MSLIPILDISNGRFVLRCVECTELFSTPDILNDHHCGNVNSVNDKE